MADKFVKAFKVSGETYNVMSVNDTEQDDKIVSIQSVLQELKTAFETFKTDCNTFMDNITARIDAIEARLDYEEEDNGIIGSSNDD